MKKQLVISAVVAVMCCLTACGKEVELSPVETSLTTTTPIVTTGTEAVSETASVATTTAPATTTAEATTTEKASTTSATTTSASTTSKKVTTTTTAKATQKKTTTTTTTKKVTTTKKPTTTTKKTTTVTTTKAPKVTTTKKATTTKKVTTTKKATTTKKVTTTKKATTTKKVTTTTAKKANLTQADVDRLVKELQEYSNSLETDAKTDSNFKAYLEKEYGSVENWYVHRAANQTPSNSSWNGADFFTPKVTYDYVLEVMKESIDFTYQQSPNCHVVIYAQWCPNGKGCCNSYQTSDGWDIYCLR